MLNTPELKIGAAMTDEELLTIGKMAEKFGVTLRLLRFYEKKELLKPRRKETMQEFGQRLYDQSQQDRLAIIQKFTKSGVSLDDIHAFLRPLQRLMSPDVNTWDRSTQLAALKLLTDTQTRLASEENTIARQLGNNRNFRAEIHAE